MCEELGLTGRIIIAHEGINGTLGGEDEAIATYEKEMLAHPLFSTIDFKQSNGSAHDFPRLRVVVKKEIVNLGIDPEVISAKNSSKHLTPQEAHHLISQKPDNLVILDVRNIYESRIGSFIDALKPPIDNFRDLPGYIDSNSDLFKDKQVLMYCTGGIRCERASVYLAAHTSAQEVYQIEGGIHRYIEQYPDGYFQGKNYVFDGRRAVQVTTDVLTQCDACHNPYDEYINCMNAECHKHIIVCPSCIPTYSNTCSQLCHDLIIAGKANIRNMAEKQPECIKNR